MCACVCICGKAPSLGVVYGLVAAAFLLSAASEHHIPEREGRRGEERVRKKGEEGGEMEIKGEAEKQRERRARERIGGQGKESTKKGSKEDRGNVGNVTQM